MASSNGHAPEEQRYRTAADEEADYQQVVKNLTSQSYNDWPNEAGFDGLTEERGPIEIPVIGTIPAWTAGNLYRTGPGQLKVENTPKGTHHITHWFDGIAHSHRFEIVPPSDETAAEAGKVRVFYSSRRQSPGRIRIIQEGGAKKLFSFGQRSDPCIGLLGKFMSTFKAVALGSPPRPNDSDNVNVVVFTDLPGFKSKPSSVARETQATTEPEKGAEPVSKAPQPPTTSGHRANHLPSNVWITTDANIMREVDPATLEPIGSAVQTSLHPDLKGALSCAHAQRDPETGDFYNFNLDLGPTPTYRIFRVSTATGKAEILATIQSGGHGGVRPAYIHSFFLTAHYVVLCVPPIYVAQNGLKLLWERNVVGGIEPFNPANKVRWIVVDRRPGRSGVVAEFDSDAGFFFHSINAHEEEEEEEDNASRGQDGAKTGNAASTSLICDAITYPNFDVINALYYDVLLNKNGATAEFYKDPKMVANVTPSLSRFRLRLPATTSSGAQKTTATTAVHKSTAAALAAERLWSIPGPHAGELPTINPAYATKPHRFVYSFSDHGRSTLADGLVKTDTAARTSLHWNAPDGHTPGEAIFIPRPGGTDEDDGALLSVVLNGATGKSYLLCLDARTMEELGRAEVGFAVGFGFHGIHAKA